MTIHLNNVSVRYDDELVTGEKAVSDNARWSCQPVITTDVIHRVRDLTRFVLLLFQNKDF